MSEFERKPDLDSTPVSRNDFALRRAIHLVAPVAPAATLSSSPTLADPATPSSARWQRQAAEPVLQASVERRDLHLQRETAQASLQRQIAQHSAALPPGALEMAVQRQREVGVPPQMPAVFERQLGGPQAQPTPGDWSGLYAAEMARHTPDARGMYPAEPVKALQRQVSGGLAASARRSMLPPTERYAEVGGALARLQRLPLGGATAKWSLGQMLPGERPAIQRALDEAVQRQAAQDAQDQQVQQVQALQRQLDAHGAQTGAQVIQQHVHQRHAAGSPLTAAVQRQLAVDPNRSFPTPTVQRQVDQTPASGPDALQPDQPWPAFPGFEKRFIAQADATRVAPPGRPVQPVPARTPAPATTPAAPAQQDLVSADYEQAVVDAIQAATKSKDPGRLPPLADTKAIVPRLLEEMARQSITDPAQIAIIVANAGHESLFDPTASENMNYTTAKRIKKIYPSRFKDANAAAPYVNNPEGLANRVYAGKLGNGNEASGDGYAFRGRGLIQVTGRDNYKGWTTRLKTDFKGADGKPVDFEKNPELMAREDVALRVAVQGVKDGTFTGSGSLAKWLAKHTGRDATTFASARGAYVGQNAKSEVGSVSAELYKAIKDLNIIEPTPAPGRPATPGARPTPPTNPPRSGTPAPPRPGAPTPPRQIRPPAEPPRTEAPTSAPKYANDPDKKRRREA